MVVVREIGCTASLDKFPISGYSMLVNIHTRIEGGYLQASSLPDWMPERKNLSVGRECIL
ncbi:hypothetical protein KSD_87870 [Ktedonobacter sp. SOSP1-85]|nr:hypothetical protein KSD_87870 [Ktedonobacter sp. SOSP1-85]